MRICVPTPLTPAAARPSLLYARAARVFRDRPGLAVAILVGSTMHGTGHALLAAAGGLLARSLAGGAGPMDARSMEALTRAGRGDPLVALAWIGVAAASLKLIGGAAGAYAEARAAGEVAARLRLEVLDRVHGVHALRPPRHDDHGPLAHRVAALTTHVHDVERGVEHGVLAQVRAAIQLAPLAAVVVAVAPSLAASAAAALVTFGVLAFGARRALVRAHRRATANAEALLGAADEAVRHADVWVTFGAEASIRAHVERVGRAIVATAARLRAWAASLSATSEVLGALALLLVVSLVSVGALGRLDRGAILPFSIAFFMAYKPLRDFVDARMAIARAAVALERMDPSGEPAPRARATPRAWPLAELSVDGLVAAHGEHAPVGFRLAPGTIAAIVGPTGIGKTSLLRALLGLESPRAGAIAYGGEDLVDRPAGPDQRPFAWAPQDAPVLCATLEENVALGAAGADVAAILDAIGATALARLGDVRLVAERPVSGGERSQIAVARAFAADAPVVLLDEPTSNLDDRAQAAMLRAIARLRGRRSVILVTHRPEPLAIADVVVRLAPARVADEAAPASASRARSA